MPAASIAVHPNLQKGLFFCHRRGIDNFCRLFSTQQCPNVFVSDVGPAPATYHRGVCEHCDQTVGRSPSRARPVQISWRSCWFCRSMSVLDSESPHSNKHLASISQADLGPRSAQECFYGGFTKSLTLFFSKICAHCEQCINLLAGIFEILTFDGNIAFPLSPVYGPFVFLPCASAIRF